MELWNDFKSNSGRTIHKWKHYFPVYERHFFSFKDRPFTLLEIGTGDGGSAQMWSRYFGPYAKIVSIDIRPECKIFEDDDISIRIGDQSSHDFLKSIVDEFGVPDIVIDDGSHKMKDIIETFKFLYYQMPVHGIYLVEDLHTAYWPDYGGGLYKDGSFIEFSKKLIDELNADVSNGAIEPTKFTKNTNSICFYNSIVVFERGNNSIKKSILSGSTGHFGIKE